MWSMLFISELYSDRIEKRNGLDILYYYVVSCLCAFLLKVMVF
jgi:hypothetical protein